MPNTKTYKVSYFFINNEELRESFAKELGECTRNSKAERCSIRQRNRWAGATHGVS